MLGARRAKQLQIDNVAAKTPGIASFLYRSSIARKVGPYDTELNGAEDWDMWLRILEMSDSVHVDSVLYYYRLHSNTMTSSIPEKVAAASCSAVKKMQIRHGGEFDLDRVYPRLKFAADLPKARWQARTRLAGFLVDSPFCPASVTANLLVQSLREYYQSEVQRNLIVHLCRHGAWEMAIRSIDELRARMPSPQLDQFRTLLVAQDSRIIQGTPIYQIPDQDLLFKLGHA